MRIEYDYNRIQKKENRNDIKEISRCDTGRCDK